MNGTQLATRKVAVIGAGLVGATSAYAMIISGLCSELVMVDVNKDKAKGEVLDLMHGASFVKPVQITAGDYGDAAGADVVLLTAGVNQRPGESRLDLVTRNAQIFKDIVPRICAVCPDALLLVVTNPVDILTWVTLKISGFPPSRVIGSGTVLDSSRFRRVLSDHFGLAAISVHAFVIGEHGDTELPVWSLANVAGTPIEAYSRALGSNKPLEKDRLFGEVKNAANQIISGKGATYYAIGLAVRRILEAVLRDENSILTVSSLLEGAYGLSGICLSLPSIVNASGVAKVLELPINDEEKRQLFHSAETIRGVIHRLNI